MILINVACSPAFAIMTFLRVQANANCCYFRETQKWLNGSGDGDAANLHRCSGQMVLKKVILRAAPCRSDVSRVGRYGQRRLHRLKKPVRLVLIIAPHFFVRYASCDLLKYLFRVEIVAE